MNRTRTSAALAAATAVLLLASCSSEPTYDESAADCIAAVNTLPKGAQAEPRPEACEPLKETDYNLIFMSRIASDLGMIDESGNPNLTGTPSP
ncbi:hypothetical protein ACODT3_10680 [Streptomyces sp. 4.24]|uniref:hypothetical protein n=1 Tax=Streptomyces tritrimontium TaxID=3406573 RepID=UPI003BB7C44F